MIKASNREIFSLVRDNLLEGKSVKVTVRGQSMLPFFRSGQTIDLRPIRPEDIQCTNVVLGESNTGTFVVHRIVCVEQDIITLMGDGNIIGTERIARNKIYGIIDCSRKHLLLAKLWFWAKPLRRYPLWIFRRIFKEQ